MTARRIAIALVWLACAGLIPGGAAGARDDRPQIEQALLARIRVLASDDFAGREPGTDGERKTLRYLAHEWFDIGLSSGTNDPAHDWFAPVTLIARAPDISSALFIRRGRRQYVPRDAVWLVTSGKRTLLHDAPLLFVGRGSVGDVAGKSGARGADPVGLPAPPALPLPAARPSPAALGRAELAGRVAVLLEAGITDSHRQNDLLAAGAAAVLTVLDGDRTLADVMAHRRRAGYAIADDAIGGDLEGFVTKAGVQSLLRGSGLTLPDLQAAAARPDFTPQALDVAATLEATSRETTILTHNLIGKLPGRRPDGAAVLFVAHWDHFGVCAEPPAEDLICNGAVDNASGVAVMAEIARRLSDGGRTPDRDVYFLATTGEELGLLGARAFAQSPPLPLKQIVAAINIDMEAIAPRGTPIAIVGRGLTRLDAQIEAVAKREHKPMVKGDPGKPYVERQDGWALLAHDVPSVMVSSAYGDLPRLERYIETDYHRPSDDLKHPIELGGAAEDVLFDTALARWFGDAKRVPAPR